MKTLELTPERQKKLEEMVNTLFPEYNKDVQYEGGRGCRPEHKISVLNSVALPYIEHGDKEPLKYNVQFQHIDWFQFCTIHIMEKLLRDGGQREFREYMNVCFGFVYPQWDILSPQIHPVDYLYNKFKSLQ